PRIELRRNGGAQRLHGGSPQVNVVSQPLGAFRLTNQACTARSSGIVAADGISLHRLGLPHGAWPALLGSTVRTTRFDERAQERQRQNFVAGVGCLVELGGKRGLS